MGWTQHKHIPFFFFFLNSFAKHNPKEYFHRAQNKGEVNKNERVFNYPRTLHSLISLFVFDESTSEVLYQLLWAPLAKSPRASAKKLDPPHPRRWSNFTTGRSIPEASERVKREFCCSFSRPDGDNKWCGRLTRWDKEEMRPVFG